MTTIAWDEDEIVADGQANNGNEMIVSTTVKKLRKLKNGGVLGFAGSWSAGEAFAKWFDGEAESPVGIDGYSVVYIDPKGKGWLYDNTTTGALPLPQRGAIGSGGTYATAILDYGGTALDAVRIAAKRDLCTGGKITSLRYKD